MYLVCFYCLFLYSLKLNIWDVGGQKSLRSYWRNYFECTDGLVWVVDSADHRRLEDCKKELSALLKEEVCYMKLLQPDCYIQWNLAISATLGTNKSGWISEVAGFQGRVLM